MFIASPKNMPPHFKRKRAQHPSGHFSTVLYSYATTQQEGRRGEGEETWELGGRSRVGGGLGRGTDTCWSFKAEVAPGSASGVPIALKSERQKERKKERERENPHMFEGSVGFRNGEKFAATV